MGTIVGDLVVFDDDQASDEGIYSYEIGCEMHNRTLSFLVGGMCRLENENGLYEGQDAGGVE